MPRSSTQDPSQKAHFRVSITGLPSIGFMKVSGLKAETAVIEYDEGGFTNTRKLRGREKVEPVTLERGIYAEQEDLWELYKATLANKDYRRTVSIELLNDHQEVVRTWTLAEAWCSSWEGPDLDASTDDVAVEKVTLVFEYFA